VKFGLTKKVKKIYCIHVIKFHENTVNKLVALREKIFTTASFVKNRVMYFAFL